VRDEELNVKRIIAVIDATSAVAKIKKARVAGADIHFNS